MRTSLVWGLIVTASLGMSAARAAEPIHAVTSFSVLADMVEQVGGEHVDVTSLVAADSDTHVFSPSPSDARRLAEADLVVFNGLQFEGWMQRLIDASDYTGTLVTASDGVATLAGDEEEHTGHDEGHHEHDHDAEHDHQHGGIDPHAWLDVKRGERYVANIRDGLIAADPDHADDYRQQASRYLAELDALDRDIHALIDAIPSDRRVVVTGHDAFNYFADAYAVRFLSPVGLNTAASPSAADMARLIDVIRDNNVQALFHENITNPTIIRQLAEEAGVPIAGTLYSGALASQGPASTYAGMMRHNAQLMHDGLARDEQQPSD